jgi:GNAT superfamily N-acetyltransferase
LPFPIRLKHRYSNTPITAWHKRSVEIPAILHVPPCGHRHMTIYRPQCIDGMNNIEVVSYPPNIVALTWPEFVAAWANQYRSHWRNRFQLLANSTNCSNPNAQCLVATARNEAVAALHIELPNENLPQITRAGWLANVWVRPEMRRLGIASRLIRFAVSDPQFVGVRSWALTTSRSNSVESENLYFREGFMALGKDSAVMVLERMHEQAENCHSCTVQLRLTDIGAFASIFAKPHHSYSAKNWSISSTPDPEEVFSQRLASGRGLGWIGCINNLGTNILFWCGMSESGQSELAVVPVSQRFVHCSESELQHSLVVADALMN